MPAKKKTVAKPANLPSPQVIAQMQRMVSPPQFYKQAYDAYDQGTYPAEFPEGMPRPMVYQLKQTPAPIEYPLQTTVQAPVRLDDGRTVNLPQRVPALGPLPEEQHNAYYDALQSLWQKARSNRGQAY